MFQYFFVARKRFSRTGKSEVKVLECYPQSVDELLAAEPRRHIADFCFPEATQEAAVRTARFTFTLTDKNGGWLYGFCVRPTARKANCMDCLCILSPHPWFDLYYEVLGYAELEYGYGTQTAVATALHQTVPVPEPGERFAVVTNDNRFYVTRPVDTFPLVDAPLAEFFATFGITGGLDLLAAVLEERRVLITGDDLDLVTGCIHALTSLLYPFTWHHPFVPVLPPTMLDAICSPTPFIMGIHSEVLEKAAALPTETVVLGDVRRGSITGLTDADRVVLPSSVTKLKDKVREAVEKKGRSKTERTLSCLTAVADFFACIFGRVREFQVTVTDRRGEQRIDVDDEKFAAIWAGDKRVHKFMTTVMATQGYQQWKTSLTTWEQKKRDTFAERAALRYPHLWDGYVNEAALKEAKAKSGGFLGRLARTRDNVRSRIGDGLANKKDGGDGARRDEKATPASSRTSSPDACRVSPASPDGGVQERSWLDDVGDSSQLRKSNDPNAYTAVAADFPGDFIVFHTSLHPFSVHTKLSEQKPKGSPATSSPAPPTYTQRELVITKIDGRIGCKYMGNNVTEVVPGSAAEKAGLVPGMKMVGLNSERLTNDSRLVKGMLDSANSPFTLTVRTQVGIGAQVIQPVALSPASLKPDDAAPVQVAPSLMPAPVVPTPGPATSVPSFDPNAPDGVPAAAAVAAPVAEQPPGAAFNTLFGQASPPAQPQSGPVGDLDLMFSAPTVEEAEAAKAAAAQVGQPIDPFSDMMPAMPSAAAASANPNAVAAPPVSAADVFPF